LCNLRDNRFSYSDSSGARIAALIWFSTVADYNDEQSY
jgi:hypothetical protein